MIAVEDRPWMGTLVVFVLRDGPHGRQVQVGAGPDTRWEDVVDQAIPTPSFECSREDARELLDALARHFGGAGDVRLLRADLEHERDRVDRMLEAILGGAAIAVERLSRPVGVIEVPGPVVGS